jgi:hypothetical protein
MIFYVYVYLNRLKPGFYDYGSGLVFNYEPFYVGKGKLNRYLYHLNKVRNNCKYNKSLKFDIIEENIKNNLDPLIIIIHDKLIEIDSLTMEKEIITKIGRLDLKLGPLTNRNDGGLKPQDNYKHNKESKLKISEGGKKRDPEKRYKLISPSGEIFDNIKLLNFCNENNLDYQKIRKSSNRGIIKEIRITSKKQSKLSTLNCVGWEVINKKLSNYSIREIKYKLISPFGKEILIYKGDILKDICLELILDTRTLRYYKNKGVIHIKNKNQSNNESINCEGWEFIDPQHHL